jgi:hypothetical protein
MAKLQSGSNVYDNLTVQTFLTVTGNVIGVNLIINAITNIDTVFL